MLQEESLILNWEIRASICGLGLSMCDKFAKLARNLRRKRLYFVKGSRGLNSNKTSAYWEENNPQYPKDKGKVAWQANNHDTKNKLRWVAVRNKSRDIGESQLEKEIYIKRKYRRARLHG